MFLVVFVLKYVEDLSTCSVSTSFSPHWSHPRWMSGGHGWVPLLWGSRSRCRLGTAPLALQSSRWSHRMVKNWCPVCIAQKPIENNIGHVKHVYVCVSLLSLINWVSCLLGDMNWKGHTLRFPSVISSFCRFYAFITKQHYQPKFGKK